MRRILSPCKWAVIAIAATRGEYNLIDTRFAPLVWPCLETESNLIKVVIFTIHCLQSHDTTIV